MIIEHHTFRLRDDVSEGDFLEADRRVQQEFAPFCTGFVRRTTARGDDGEWLVETLWGSAEEAEAASDPADAVLGAFLGLLDAGTSSVRHWSTLD